jgi:hypothetical protein
MQTYKEFRPTGFDDHISLDDKEDWLVVPCGTNRDADCLTESNYYSALEELSGEGDDVEVLEFGHWACGWFSIIVVRPDTEAHKTAEEIESALADYPILDEDDFSEREQKAADETWKNCYTNSQRIAYIKDHRNQFEFHDLADMVSCVRGNHFAGYACELICR